MALLTIVTRKYWNIAWGWTILNTLKFNVGFATDIGRKRQKNQDNGGAFPELGLFVVADGMGGHRGGEVASSLVLEVLPEFVKKAEKKKKWDPRQVISDGIRAANRAIYQKAQQEPDLQGMGTTTVSLLFRDGKLTVGHVGDSRCYFFRPDAIWQVTRDHSLVQEKLRAGLITRAQVATDLMKNVITRSVGFEEDVNVEIYEMPCGPGDVFLLCSDGLSGLVQNPQILSTVHQRFFDGGDLQGAVTALIAAANENGGDDNVTVLMAQVAES